MNTQRIASELVKLAKEVTAAPKTKKYMKRRGDNIYLTIQYDVMSGYSLEELKRMSAPLMREVKSDASFLLAPWEHQIGFNTSVDSDVNVGNTRIGISLKGRWTISADGSLESETLEGILGKEGYQSI